MIRTTLLLAAIALTVPQAQRRIVLSHGEGTLDMAVDGTMTVVEGTRRETFQTGLTTYPRIAALVKPVRRWAGGKVPCTGEPPFVEGFWKVPVTRIRWEPEGLEVEVPIACRQGPAEDEIELVRAAFDEARGFAHDAQTANDLMNNSAAALESED
jgi:hypothetical protein